MGLKFSDLEIQNLSKEDIIEKLKNMQKVRGVELDLEVQKGKIGGIEISHYYFH
ncbi:hypothetical protein [Saccharolobus solfataricus]|uniref:Uncharacterized protein n=2 Tax=Saccharolobus solfataricus TaxID=2287 RepID=A0A157T0C2_SACSO|nr:hypothetical protein [Saccharolobus solfataricus]QPG48759.1 hypothetical protein HFC64_01075 [Saccharolobus solfataricus]SAI84812.1 uncharacterised protein [Saccharolobus solfataricus]